MYRASRDGNTTAAFHEKCDNKGATIVVTRIKDSEQIVGGYNPLFWSSNTSDNSTYDSFLFSFTNRSNLHSAKVSYSKGDQYSVRSRSTYGPMFGGGSDLYFDSNGTSWYSYNHPYSYQSKVDIPNGAFSTEDYEVFQVTKDN